MATKEIYRIGIQVGVDGVEESKQKLSSMERYTQQTEKRLKMLNKITASPTVKLKDQTSSAIDKINVKSKSLSRAVVSTTAKINDQATGKLNQINTTIKRLQNTNITATLRINDQATDTLNRVRTRRDRLRNANINPTARVSNESSEDTRSPSERTILTSGFRSGNMSASNNRNNTLEDSENAENVVSNNIGRKISGAGDKISKVGDKLNTHVTLPILGAGVASAKFSMDFGNGMAKISTVADTTNISLDKLGKGVIDLSNMSGESFSTIQDGMYDTISSGVAAEKSVGFLTTAVKAAKGGFTDTATSVDGLTTILNAYGLKTEEVSNIANQMFIAQNLGKTTFGEMSSSLGNVVPTASALKVSTAELFSSLATLTANGIKTSEAVTGLKAAYSNIAKPTDDAAKMAKSLGLSFNAAHLQSVGWGNFLKEVKEKTHGNTEQLYQLFGSVEAVNTVLTMTSDQGMNLFSQSMDQMSTNTTALDEAFNKVNDTAGSKLQRNFNELKNSSIKLGDALAPVIKEISDTVGTLASTLDGMDDTTLKTITNTGLFIAALGPVIKIAGTLTKSFGTIINIGSKLGPLLGITTASTAGIALAALAALGIGIAGVKTHNDLMAKSFDTSTDDLSTWEKVINTLTGSTIKSKKELVDAGLAYEDFSDSLSDNFKNSVEEASKAFNKLKMTLAFDSRNGVNFTDSMASDIKSQVDAIVKSAKDAVMSKRSEMQNTLSQLFNMGDGKIDENESKVMDNIAAYQDSKFDTIQTLNENIYNTLNNAVAQHKKLTEEDIENIKNWTRQIQALQIESSATNDVDKAYASNQSKFQKRLSSMTADEALSAMKDAYGQIININQDAEDKQKDIISKAQALEPELQDAYAKAISKGDKAKAEQLKNSIELIQKKVTEAQDKLNSSVKERQDKTRDLWDAFYEANPTMRGQMNEVNFSKLSEKDKGSQGNLYKIKQKYQEVANATKSGIKHVKDAAGSWHDIYVTVDEGTKLVTSAFDINAKPAEQAFGGYSEQFENDAKATGEAVKKSMEELAGTFNYNMPQIKQSKIKLSGDSLVNTDTNSIISKFDTIIQKSNGLKTAITNINGEQVKIEFDENGAIKNEDDVRKAIIDHLASSPAKIGIDIDDKDAVEKFKKLEDLKDQLIKNGGINSVDIKIDNKNVSSVDELIRNLENLPRDKNIDLVINGEQITTIDGAIDKLSKLPKETKIDVNDKDALSKISNVNEKINAATRDRTITIHTVTSGMGDIISLNEEKFASKKLAGHANGTNNAARGLAEVSENGFEIVMGRQVRWFNGGEKVLTHEKSKAFLKKQQENEPFQVKQGQFQLVQPQLKVVGTGGISVGDIQVSVNGNQDSKGIINEVVQVVGFKLKEALANIKR